MRDYSENNPLARRWASPLRFHPLTWPSQSLGQFPRGETLACHSEPPPHVIPSLPLPVIPSRPCMSFRAAGEESKVPQNEHATPPVLGSSYSPAWIDSSLRCAAFGMTPRAAVAMKVALQRLSSSCPRRHAPPVLDTGDGSHVPPAHGFWLVGGNDGGEEHRAFSSLLYGLREAIDSDPPPCMSFRAAGEESKVPTTSTPRHQSSGPVLAGMDRFLSPLRSARNCHGLAKATYGG